jgi:hypothetical protein
MRGGGYAGDLLICAAMYVSNLVALTLEIYFERGGRRANQSSGLHWRGVAHSRSSLNAPSDKHAIEQKQYNGSDYGHHEPCWLAGLIKAQGLSDESPY